VAAEGGEARSRGNPDPDSPYSHRRRPPPRLPGVGTGASILVYRVLEFSLDYLCIERLSIPYVVRDFPIVKMPSLVPTGAAVDLAGADGGQGLLPYVRLNTLVALQNPLADIDLMLTEATVRTSIAKAIDFINRTREPYALLFLDIMHRRFGVEQFADALQRYDEVLRERPKDAPLLRVLRRIADANNPIQPDDWDHVTIHTDRILVSALYCDRLGLPPSFAEVLSKSVKAGGYYATHALLAWIWINDNRCTLAVPDGFVEEMYATVAAIIDDQPTLINDLKLEAAAFLCLARQGRRVDPRFVERVVAIQNDDGGWGKPDEVDPSNPGASSWHSTILALLLLLHVHFPAAQSVGARS